tara:strand:+ start:12198 stop:12911 length:714 start_codon:yes stop_codon:yes gene_type:complete
MIKKVKIIPILAFLFLFQGCYTQLAWLHQPESEKEEFTFNEEDPYGLNGMERYTDFIPYSQNPYGYNRYGYDSNFWSYHGNYGSPFGLYSPYSSYYSNQMYSPYGYGYNRYGYYPYSTGYGLTSPIIFNEVNSQPQRKWDRRDMTSSGSNLVIRREVPLMMVTAQPIRKQSPNSKFISSPFFLAKNSNIPSSRVSSYNTSTTRSWNSGGSFSGTRSSGRTSSSSTKSSSSGRVTRRR